MPKPLTELNEDFQYQILENVAGRPLKVGGEMQLADMRNANGRVYSESLWKRVLESSNRTMKRLKERRMLGELDHPESGKTKLRQVSHVMTELRLQPSARFPGKTAVYGVYECLPTPDGKILEALLRSGVGVQVSSRGDGDLEERGGDQYVIPESYDLDTFDVVIDPSVNTDVKMIESKQKGECSCQTPRGSSTEAIVNAIYSIVVESGDFDKDCGTHYKTMLEEFSGLESETYLKAQEALRVINEHLEVKSNMKPNTTDGTQPAGAVTESQVVELKARADESMNQLTEANKRADAAQKAVEALLLQSRQHKMRADFYEAEVAKLRPTSARYEDAKRVIGKCRETILGLQKEGKLRLAAESLLGALLTKIDEAKRTSYVDRILAKESVETQNRLRPILLKCESRRAVNETFIAVKPSLSEARSTARGLPPLSEHGRRRASISEHSPLMENKGRVVDGRVEEEIDEHKNVRIGGQSLTEQISFSKKLVKSMK